MTGPPALTDADFPAFRRAWQPSRPSDPQEFSEDFLVKFQEVFAEFSDGDSWLRGCDLRRFASRVGLPLTSDQVREFLKTADQNQFGQLHYAEVLYFCSRAVPVEDADAIRANEAGAATEASGPVTTV